MPPPVSLSRGVYAITPDEPSTARLVARVAPVLTAGVVCLQYRNKAAPAPLRREQAGALLGLCRAAAVPMVVNDDLELAIELGADGVHLGGGDGDIASARARMGSAAIIGASCYDSLQRARDAAAAGASYIAFGAFHPSSTKPDARRADPSLLVDSASLGLPRVAIGGITPRNARALVAAGADLLAVISGVFDAPDAVAALHAYQAAFQEPVQ